MGGLTAPLLPYTRYNLREVPLGTSHALAYRANRCGVGRMLYSLSGDGLRGGVKSQQITGNTFRIVSRGNAYTSNVKIQDYTLLKAAETTRAAGATHFMIVSSEDATRTGYIETASTARTTVSGNTAHTTFDPGAKIQLVKPGQDTYIRVFTIAAGQSPPPGSMSAAEIIQFVGSRVKNG